MRETLSTLTMNISQSKSRAVCVCVCVCVHVHMYACMYMGVCMCVNYTAHTFGLKEQGNFTLTGSHLFFQNSIHGL